MGLSPCCLHPCACKQGGAVLGRPWQLHESHLPYLLQLKIDFNLAGMGWLRLSHARFRWVTCGERLSVCSTFSAPVPECVGHIRRLTWQVLRCSLPCPMTACRHPLPAAFTRQRRGWATRQLVVGSEPGADSLLPSGALAGQAAGPGCAGTPGGSASQCMRLWTASTVPRSWLWGGGGGAPVPGAAGLGPAKPAGGGGHGGGGGRGGGRVPRRQSTCQLELDASVEHILNRQQVRGRAGSLMVLCVLRRRPAQPACRWS